jgi:DNA replicative helicase MCM subunit Mcm2 (Cdc46/Mcm family)
MESQYWCHKCRNEFTRHYKIQELVHCLNCDDEFCELILDTTNNDPREFEVYQEPQIQRATISITAVTRVMPFSLLLLDELIDSLLPALDGLSAIEQMIHMIGLFERSRSEQPVRASQEAITSLRVVERPLDSCTVC